MEATVRLLKSSIYPMSTNISLGSTIEFLIIRAEVQKTAFDNALETLGIDWAKPSQNLTIHF